MNTSRTKASRSSRWLVPTGLLLLSVVPLVFGAVRLVQLATGAEITAANARFFAAPAPVIVHIVGSAVFAVFGAFQFVTGESRRTLGWHRVAGWLSAVAGLFVGLSGLWMTMFYPNALDLLYVFRLAAGSGMVVSIGLGIEAVRRRDILGHRAWLMRAYALGLGAGTQVLTGVAESLVVAHPDALSRALAMGAAWLINLGVVEWVIRRRPTRRARVVAPVAPTAR